MTGTVWFQWQSADGRWYDGVGTTRDIGKAGVFVESEVVPRVASALRVMVVLPAGWGTATPLCLNGSGHVRHVQQESSHTNGFGAKAVFNVEVPITTGH